jgi:hypothetical protein
VSDIVSSQDDDRLVIQRLCVSAKRAERQCELSSESFGGGGVKRPHHIDQAVATEFSSSEIRTLADAVAVQKVAWLRFELTGRRWYRRAGQAAHPPVNLARSGALSQASSSRRARRDAKEEGGVQHLSLLPDLGVREN